MNTQFIIWIDESRIDKLTDSYIAYSDQFKLAGFGNTKVAAKRSLEDAIQTSLRDLAQQGILFETLNKLQIEFQPINSEHAGKPILFEYDCK